MSAPLSAYKKELNFLTKCRNANARKSYISRSKRKKGLQTGVQRACAQLVKRGGDLKPSLRRKLQRHRARLIQAGRSRQAAGRILQGGGSFLSDIWAGIKSLVGL